MTPQDNPSLRKLRTSATTPEARLIENPETRFPREQAIALDEVQAIMNELYRKDAEYGDGSCAFMVMKEQFEGGVGNPPLSLKKGTLHGRKCREYRIALTNPLPNLPPEAQTRIQEEIQKMNEALQWAQQYQNDEDPAIPKWARPWQNQLGK
jgi:hypothetical protein